MKRKLYPISLLLFTLALLSGCELYYLPPQIQTPTHEQKGDLAVNLQGLYTLSGSASYAITNNLFLGGSFMNYSNQNDSNSSDFFRVGTVEGGYYHFDTTRNLHVEAMIGFGNGQAGDAEGFDVNFSRFYIQPSIGFLTEGRNIENHLTFRYSTLNYDEQPVRQVRAFSTSFIEPAYTMRLGTEHLKFHWQLGLSMPIGPSNGRPTEFAFDPFIFGFGVNWKFNALGR